MKKQITTNLFIISPNNSGSTLLRKLLEQSSYVWHLEREGQHVPGFVGPSSHSTGARLLWASSHEWVDQFRNAAEYNWIATQLAWYRQAVAECPSASVFVTSSPPFLLNLKALVKYFKNTRFLIMVRNPYAAIEGIVRRRKLQPVPEGQCCYAAAQHMATCFKYQKDNIENYSGRAIFFTYEDLCGNTDDVCKRIQSFVPELEDLDFSVPVEVKNRPQAVIRNMNSEQVNKLPDDCVEIVNDIFSERQELLNYFGYSLLKI